MNKTSEMENKMSNKNREAWLQDAVAYLTTELFEPRGYKMPEVRVSVGWPGGGRSNKRTTLGECWSPDSAGDGVSQIFISPTVDDSVVALATLVHEMVHAWDGLESGHKGEFVKCARAVGLEGKPTATYAGQDLQDMLNVYIETVGDFPTAALAVSTGGKKQTTRMLKVVCPISGYVLRTTAKWLDSYGAPLCPCHESRMDIA